jgi:hypothetical protein
MSLQDRSRGYEFSEFEKELIFRRENTGLVQYISKDGKLFSLNPSLFFEPMKNEHFFAESCDPPPNNTFVEVEVSSADPTYTQTHDGFRKDILKNICGWKPFDPSQIAQRQKLIAHDQIIQFFSHPFRCHDDITESISTCAALYAFSSPPITDATGGVNAAILSKKTQWEAFKRPMNIIPREFFQADSKYFYCISAKEKLLHQNKSEEINLAFLNPEKLMADIPIVIEDISINRIYGVQKDDIEDNRKFITAYLIDSLMIKPNPMETVVRQVTDAVYEIRDEYLRSGISPYRQNLGDAIPKLSASIARLHLDAEVKPDYVKKVIKLWKEMHRRVRYRMGDSLSISKYYEFSDNTRKLYTELHDIYGKEYPIPMQEVIKFTSLKNEMDFNHSVNELVERGFAIRDRRGITLLEKWGQ